LKDSSDGTDATSTGKVFHTLTAAMGKARSPIVLFFERRTTGAAVDANRSRRLESTAYLAKRPSLVHGTSVPYLSANVVADRLSELTVILSNNIRKNISCRTVS